MASGQLPRRSAQRANNQRGRANGSTWMGDVNRDVQTLASLRMPCLAHGSPPGGRSRLPWKFRGSCKQAECEFRGCENQDADLALLPPRLPPQPMPGKRRESELSWRANRTAWPDGRDHSRSASSREFPRGAMDLRKNSRARGQRRRKGLKAPGGGHLHLM